MTADLLDVGVVGAGPCGIAVAVAARRRSLRCLNFESGALTQAILEHPTYTTYFSGPEKLEVGGLPFTTAGEKPTRREALRYYRRVAGYYDLDVRQFENVVTVTGAWPEFRIDTRRMSGEAGEYRCRNVVIATGYYQSPNRLAVPGADLPKVQHYYREPFPYFDQDVLVVGGGNSAADAALGCWREGARVTLVHLFAELDAGVKPWVRPDIENRIAEGAIPALWLHRVVEVGWREVVLEGVETGAQTALPNDWVLAMTGFAPDHGLLRALGAEIDTATGIPAHSPETMRTTVPGVYLAGVVAAGYDANKIFIENGRLHGELIAAAIAGQDSG